MIAVDTSTVIAYFAGDSGSDIKTLDAAFMDQAVLFPPIVVTEFLSARNLSRDWRDEILSMPMLEIKDGYFARAGFLRAKLLDHGYKAHLGDTLIAQSCIDHEVQLLTRDRDYRHFVRLGGLQLCQ